VEGRLAVERTRPRMTPDPHHKGSRTKTGVFELYRTISSLATEASEVLLTEAEFRTNRTATTRIDLSGGSAGCR
jgi:hypothetical protein